MFQRPIVFVIGAGCSREYGLPVGDSLKSIIIEKMKRLAAARERSDQPDQLLVSAVNSLAHAEGVPSGRSDILGPWLNAAGEVARGLGHASSIDRFLHFRRDDERIVSLGKLAIVRSILEAEERSSLSGVPLDQSRIHGIADFQPDWLSQLFLRMQEDISNRSKISDLFKNMTFVCFNYDRCIEHYFYNALKEFGSLKADEAAEAMKSLVVLHPYGRVGSLPWCSDASDAPGIGFGEQLQDPNQLMALAKGIKTFTEGEHERALLTQVHQAILQASQIAFMGFSFLDQSMTLLTPNSTTQATNIYATVLGESQSNQTIATALMKTMLKGSSGTPAFAYDPYLFAGTAGNFIHDWGNGLRR